MTIQVENSTLLLCGGWSRDASEADEGRAVRFLAGLVLLGFPGPLEITTGVAFGPVTVFIEALEQAPVQDLDQWEDVAELSVETIRGTAIEVHGSWDTFPEPGQGKGTGSDKLNANGDGWYRVRISASGRDASPDGQLTAPEQYRFQAWPAMPSEAKALKLTSARAVRLSEADGPHFEDSIDVEAPGGTGARDYLNFKLQRVDARNVALSLYDTPVWEQIGATEEITRLLADGITLGPKPAGHSFSALESLHATWSRDTASWLRGSRLKDLVIHRPTQATLDALEGVPLEFLRLQSGRWTGVLHWPRLENLTDLWFVLGKHADLAGVSTLPALRSVRIDSVKRVSSLGQLGAGPRLRTVDLEDIREVDDPAQLWQINAEEVNILSDPRTSPWVVEALRSMPSQPRTPPTRYWIPDGFYDAAKRDAADGIPGTVSRLNEFEDGSVSLTFSPMSVPTAEVLETAGVDSTGDVWAGLVGHLWPQLTEQLGLDPEAELFAANGTSKDLQQLQTQLEPLLTDDSALTRALQGVPLNRLGL